MSKENGNQDKDKPAKSDYPSKSARQSAFREECKGLGLSPQEVVGKANLFQGIDVRRFKIVRMPP